MAWCALLLAAWVVAAVVLAQSMGAAARVGSSPPRAYPAQRGISGRASSLNSSAFWPSESVCR
jgi:hypothetical protein